MTLDKRSFAGVTIDLSAPTLTLRTGGARVAPGRKTDVSDAAWIADLLAQA
jgi:hypothetical protein